MVGMRQWTELADVTVEEVNAMLGVSAADRKLSADTPLPYVWTNVVSTLDNVTAFKEPSRNHPSLEVALSCDSGGCGPQVPKNGGSVDWRLLQSGWAYADAVLTSGANLRAEPNIEYRVTERDVLAYRNTWLRSPEGHLGHGGREAAYARAPPMSTTGTPRTGELATFLAQPMTVVVSGSGNINPRHALFNTDDLHVVIITTVKGGTAFSKRIADAQHDAKMEGRGGPPVAHGVEIVELIDGDGGDGMLDMAEVLRVVRRRYGVRYIDVTAGEDIRSQVIAGRLCHELRQTTAQHIAGVHTTAATAAANAAPVRPGHKAAAPPVEKRPLLFNFNRTPVGTFTPATAPLAQLMEVRKSAC